MAKHKIVEVRWVDASSYASARTVDQCKKCSLLKMKTVGYLISEDIKVVVVSMEFCENGMYKDTTVIPRSTVISIKRLK